VDVCSGKGKRDPNELPKQKKKELFVQGQGRKGGLIGAGLLGGWTGKEEKRPNGGEPTLENPVQNDGKDRGGGINPS